MSGDTAWTRLAEGWLLTLTGEHDLATVPEIEHQMQQVCDSSANATVLIDLTEAAFIDCQVSAGWRAGASTAAAAPTFACA